jgi:two-component system chemotaxis response regulator CheB
VASKDIIVIGASAGGFDAIQRLVAGFPLDLPAAIFVTIHVSGKASGILPSIITRSGPLVAANAVDGERIENGRIYVAPPDYHLLLCPGYVQLGHGPRENLQRPCINAMFRSAAAAYDGRVAGVLLTGLLDDGAAGLWEIQQKRGTTVVQDPREANFRAMPESAVRGLNVEYIVRLAEMGPLLARLALNDRQPKQAPSTEEPSPEESIQTCPECGGAMKATKMGRLREYQCHIGHRVGLRTMIEQKSVGMERVLGSALAHSEELSSLLETALENLNGEDTAGLRDSLDRRKKEQDVLRSMVNGPELAAQVQ